MTDYKINDKPSQDEMAKLINFSKSLVIKDDREAERTETLESSTAAFNFIAASLGMDNNTQEQRRGIIANYVELNPYYSGLKRTHNIDFLTSRMAKDYSIMWHTPNVMSREEYTLFLELYYGNVKYFMSVLYTDAFMDNELYPNFIRFFLVFMTIERYVSKKLEYTGDIDFYDDYSINNMFASFGLDFYEDLPVKYRKRILKNMNNLLKYKGTDKVLIDILAMFGFDNIEVFKFYMAKDYEMNPETGTKDYSKPDVKFIKVPQGTKQIEKDILKFSPQSFESVTYGDPYWLASKEEILQENFSFINTKYTSVTSMMSMLKETMGMSYVYNMLIGVGTDKGTSHSLFFQNNKISKADISLVDALIALQILVVKRMGFVDNIISTPESLKTVYGYNFDEFFTDSGKTQIVEEYADRAKFYAKEQEIQIAGSDLEKYFINGFSSKNINGTTLRESILRLKDYPNVSKNNFVDMFVENKKYREAFENLIMKTQDYTLYKKLQTLWEIKFTHTKQQEMFEGFSTYSEYLIDKDEFLHEFTVIEDTLEEESRLSIINEKILELASTIDTYLDSEDLDVFLTNNSIATESIKEYLYRLLNIFKSYTVDLIDMEVTYFFDSKLFNTLRYFDETAWIISFNPKEVLPVIDRYAYWSELDLRENNLQFTDMYLGYLIITRSDLFTMAEKQDFINKRDFIDNFDTIIDKVNAMYNTEGYTDVLDITRELWNYTGQGFSLVGSLQNLYDRIMTTDHRRNIADAYLPMDDSKISLSHSREQFDSLNGLADRVIMTITE